MLYFALVAISLFFVVVICSLIVIFAIKYRRREGNEIAQDVHEHHLMEVGWSLIPLVIGLVLFAWGAKLFLGIYEPPPGGTMEIFAVGKQWMWKFQHPDGRREINDLHLPVGRPIKMTMISQDVLHSFYIPAFRIKQDVLPMRYSSTWFEPTKPGVYHLFCAEYCGTEHSRMVGRVFVMEQADYEAWLASPIIEGGAPREAAPMNARAGEAAAVAAAVNAGEPGAKGKAVLESQGCRACHQVGNPALAPQLEGIYGTQVELADGSKVKVDDDYIRQSILLSTVKVVKGYQPVMPPYQGVVNEEEVRHVIEYIKSTSGSKK
ncbi:cytochrome c oxidase subunit II [bacterium]|nr:cytochrome c oxidase subunit II [bacterium]